MAKAGDDFDLDAVDVGDESNTDDKNSPKALRDYAKSLKKELEGLREEVGKFRTAGRATSLTEALKAKGVPEEKAGFLTDLYPKDAETSEDAISAWLDKYGPAFGIEKVASNVDDEQRNSMVQMQSAVNDAPGSKALDQTQFATDLSGAKTRADVDAVYARYGMK